jgi:hypothetical protein
MSFEEQFQFREWLVVIKANFNAKKSEEKKDYRVPIKPLNKKVQCHNFEISKFFKGEFERERGFGFARCWKIQFGTN